MTETTPKIALITDSTASLPPNIVKQYNIYVVSQHLIWGTEDLRDLKDIDAKTFYERLPKESVHPKTSQPVASEFLEAVNEAKKKDGATEAVVLCISSPLSGTYQSAVQAKEQADIPLHVVDTRSVGMGLGWQVIAAARAREAGADAAGMIEAARKVHKHLAMVLTVDTLEYLHKGGRIGGAKHLIGTVLNIKPQLIVDREAGIIQPGKNSRTRKKAIEAMWEQFFSQIDTSKPLHIAIHHAAALPEAEELCKRVKEKYPNSETILIELTPVVGAHAGPGLLALTGYYED